MRGRGLRPLYHVEEFLGRFDNYSQSDILQVSNLKGVVMSERPSKWEDQSAVEHLAEIRAPNASFGTCRNHKNCHQFQAILGNGYCVKCWDTGIGSKEKDWAWRPKYG